MKHHYLWPIFILLLLITLAIVWPNNGQEVNLMHRLQGPSWSYWFGTDWLGRDMFGRTLKALLYSLSISGAAVVLCSVIALLFAVIANVNKTLNSTVDFLVDALLSLPSLLLLIILTVVLGGGTQGIIFAVSLSHWPKLARLCKQEIHTLMNQDYIQYALGFGHNKWYAILRHALPHVLPQWMLGVLLLFPHVILHIAGMSFLGFGLNSSYPSMGKILSEANTYLLTGEWWLALFPGITLVVTTLLISLSIRSLSSMACR
ncbi:ABC transporter permease [Vibrio sp. B1REV9]|uniref:ABC transporter permease n=1 Tax=Vibrio sp. B1REV9 TaxID=2751179 RepID=UPI001BAC8ED0|nr:ABC transporter permease [Vibrio sp. B1REV9]